MASHDAGDEGRKDRALIAYHRDKAEEVQRRSCLLPDRISVGQSGIHQHEANNDTDDRVPAEDAEGGPAHQGGEEGKGRIRQNPGEENEICGNGVRSQAEEGQKCLLGQKSRRPMKRPVATRTGIMGTNTS